MESLFAQFKSLADSGDEDTRFALLNFAQQMQYSLEGPADMIQRVGFAAAQTHVAETAIESGMFEVISGSEKPVSDKKIAEQIGIGISLVGRLTRAMASYGMVAEVEPGVYRPNLFTSTFARKGFQGALLHMTKSIMPAWTKTSAWVEAHKSSIPDRLPVQLAYTGNLPWFIYVGQPEHPDLLSHAALFMANWKDGRPDWLSVYPIDREATDVEPADVLFVDVGGGLGHQCQRLRQKRPELKGRVVLEDLPPVVQSAPRIENVEFVEQDFLQAQAIQGAKFYYLRWVLHDWVEDGCVKILKNLKSAMAPDSRILVDEMVIPDTGCHRESANVDLVMMSLYSASERTRGQFVEIFKKAGLQLKREFPYGPNTRDTVMELVPAERPD